MATLPIAWAIMAEGTIRTAILRIRFMYASCDELYARGGSPRKSRRLISSELQTAVIGTASARNVRRGTSTVSQDAERCRAEASYCAAGTQKNA